MKYRVICHRGSAYTDLFLIKNKELRGFPVALIRHHVISLIFNRGHTDRSSELQLYLNNLPSKCVRTLWTLQHQVLLLSLQVLALMDLSYKPQFGKSVLLPPSPSLFPALYFFRRTQRVRYEESTLFFNTSVSFWMRWYFHSPKTENNSWQNAMKKSNRLGIYYSPNILLWISGIAKLKLTYILAL